MIKVTNEMVILIEEYIETFQEHLYHNAEELARKIIELHEQSKPKPEPYGYVNGISSTDLWFPQDLSDSAKNSDRWTPLYTTPPTRETLSEDEVWRIYDEGDNVSSALEFARAVEKAHGIGV